MGQFKTQRESTIVLASNHSLILGHMPESINKDSYSDLMAKTKEKSHNENFGLFSSPSNRYYPGLSPEDWNPKDEDYITPTYRMLSEVIVNKQYDPIDFGYGGVLKASKDLLVGQSVNTNHNTDVEDAIGVVVETFWDESYKTEGKIIPAGFNGLLKIDAKANPRIARGILMDPPSIHSNSVNIRFNWDKSHPKLSDQDFWGKLGTYDEKGDLIRRVCTGIICYGETSLVSHGADPFAQIVRSNGKIINPKYATSQSYSADRGNNIDYYFIDFKDKKGISEINNTAVYNMKEENSNFINDNNNNQMNELLLALGVMLGLNGEDRTEDKIQDAVKSLIASRDSVNSLKEKNVQLEAENTNLKTEISSLKESSEMGKTFIEELRTGVTTLYEKVNSGEADQGIISLINGATKDQLISLKSSYEKQLEQLFPFTCTDCGSTNVNRGSSQTTDEEGNEQDKSTETFEELSVAELKKRALGYI